MNTPAVECHVVAECGVGRACQFGCSVAGGSDEAGKVCGAHVGLECSE